MKISEKLKKLLFPKVPETEPVSLWWFPALNGVLTYLLFSVFWGGTLEDGMREPHADSATAHTLTDHPYYWIVLVLKGFGLLSLIAGVCLALRNYLKQRGGR